MTRKIASKHNCIERQCFLKATGTAVIFALVLTGMSKADTIPFPQSLDSAAVKQDRLDNILDNSLILGNGDVNAILYSEEPNLVLRLTKNDVWDSRIDVSMNPPLLKVDIKGKRLIGLGNAPKNWHMLYPSAIICADVILASNDGAAKTKRSSALDVRRARAVASNTTGLPEATVWALAQRNVFLIESSLPASLRPVKAGHLPPAEMGETNGVKWLLQKLPGDLDWSGMTYAVAIANTGMVKAVSIVTSYEAKDPLSEAIKSARVTATAKTSELVDEHESIWQKFWSESGVELGDAALQDIWYRNLYFLRCVSKRGVKAVGLFAGLTTNEPSWRLHTINYNSEQVFCAAYPTNHIDLAEPYERMIVECLPRARSFTRQTYDCDGAAFPHNTEMLGITVTTSDLPPPEKCKSKNGRFAPFPPYSYTIGLAGYAVQNLWLHYKYQPDREYLDKIAYPAIRDVAIFYSDFMDRCEIAPNGKVILAPSYSPEHWNLTEDFKYNRNCAFDIAFIRYALQAAIDAAKVLGRDEDLAKRCKANLPRLPDYPTTKGPDPIVVDVEDAAPIEYNIAVPAVPISPGDQITWFSSDAEKKLFARTLDKIQWNGNNAVMMLATSRARLSMPNAADWIRAEFVARTRPNGTLTLNRQPHGFNDLGHYTEQFAASMVVSEMLLQSVGDILRIFPAWPAEKDAAFQNLRAQGGFLVSAKQMGGKTREVRITSTVGETLKMVSPWPGAKVICSKDGSEVPLQMDAHGQITVTTQPGETLLFCEAH